MQSFKFHPVIARWFEQKFGSATEPQRLGWPAIQAGADTLIAAPTGSGKTLAAFLAALDQLFRQGLAGELPDETTVVYVSPLKALSNDIHKNLDEPLKEIGEAMFAAEGRRVNVRADLRTGDTPASKRQAIARRPPHILVTTPESLYLLLTSASGRKLLSTVRTVIVDEIHAVVANRRGSHLALTLQRLENLVPGPLQRIGLSATQKPIETVAEFLVGSPAPSKKGPSTGDRVFSNGHKANRRCEIIDCGYARKMDLAIEVPGAPLEAVMSNEVWTEVYQRLAELIEGHRTTLVFVNTRRMAERVTHHLCQKLGGNQVTSHHGSLSAKLRLEAESRLKRGELRALVATASLELGIDIGSVDLVCQVGPTRSLATLLQRVGRARHQREGIPKGRLFPLSRDELAECAATLNSLGRRELDRLEIPQKPLDVLAQQIVACAATEDWEESELYELMRSAWPYRNLSREEFDGVITMLSEGFSTKRGRRAALLHHDAVNHRIRGRRGAGLLALTSGGAIPDTGDYRVLVEPEETFIGTVNEDFAVESQAGDIFQLGNASWKILRVNSGTVRVADAHGQPPSIPFWLGEAPGRTRELSVAVSRFRQEIEKRLEQIFSAECEQRANGDPPDLTSLVEWLGTDYGLIGSAGAQIASYFAGAYRALGAMPSQEKLLMERFFDESGGMQLVIHSTFGIRVNRAWGLALRKRFCRSFNFELQAAATDDAIILSLGTQHSFPLEEVFRYLNSKTVREVLIQALLDAPMFPIRWRWNATRALALPRQRGGRKVPAPLQRMESENLLAAVFPDQLACPENLVGDREVPDHPLVRQTIDDCLEEAMDIDGLEALLRKIETGSIQCLARDLPEPSGLAHEILNAKPYAFLDNAPLEERRTQAVYTRRAGDSGSGGELGILDPAAIETVCADAWPRAENPDELHEALLLGGLLTTQEIQRTVLGSEPAHERNGDSDEWLNALISQNRAARFGNFWVAAERLPMVQAIFPDLTAQPPVQAPESARTKLWETPDALRELVRGRLEISGPVTCGGLSTFFGLPATSVETALAALEGEGFALRGRFHARIEETEWCDRRLLARIHRLTINRLRAEIQPVSISDYLRFLTVWQRIGFDQQVEGPEGLEAVLQLFDGYQVPAAAWEPEVLASRVKDYRPEWLDRLCFTGHIGWARLTPPPVGKPRQSGPIRSSPISLFTRENLKHWLTLSPPIAAVELAPDTAQVLEALSGGGALFFKELLTRTQGLLPSRIEQSLAELAAQGWVTSDSFEGLRALLLPQDKRLPLNGAERRSRFKAVSSVEFAGRWSLLRRPIESGHNGSGQNPPLKGESEREEAIDRLARTLLKRYGIVFRRLLEREALAVSWYDLGKVYRRMEARGEIRGGYFVAGISGEQFAFPEAIAQMRAIRKSPHPGQLVTLSGADPLNLVGILTPGPRVPAISSNRIVMRDGTPVAALDGGRVIQLETAPVENEGQIEQALRVGAMAPGLRRYYA
jgi:ATP-dependent Lhr-like helicase